MEKAKEIQTKQKVLRNRFFKSIKKFQKNKIDISLSIFTFGCTWQPNTSSFNLKYLISPRPKILMKLIYKFLLDTLFIATLKNFKVGLPKYKNSYKNLMITWGGERDFDSNGSYFDKKFTSSGISNKSDKTLWYILGHDNLSKIKKANNSTLHFNQKISYNIPFLIKKIFYLLFKYKFSLKKVIHYCNFYSMFAESLAERIYHCINKNNIKNIMMPYEGQPFQKYLIKYIKQKNPKIKITGYAHSSQPLPLHLMYIDNKIDYLVAHNQDQFFHLNKRLFWPKNKLLLERSKKIKKLDKTKFVNKLMLPYGFQSTKNIMNSISFLLNNTNINIKKFEIRNHPLMRYSKKHVDMVKKINEIKKNNFNIKKFNENKTTIIIGPTSSVPEALQTVDDVYHIVEDVLIETYSNYFWPSIKVEIIGKSIIKYNTINKSNLFIK